MSEDRTKALTNYIQSAEVIGKLADVLGSKSSASSYAYSVVIAARNNQKLMQCTLPSLYTSMMRAAILRLSVDPALGQAYLIPYKDQATFVVGYRGLVHMAIRTQKYIDINVGPAYNGEEIIEDRITGRITMGGERQGDAKIGWFAYFEMFNRMRKYVYMTIEEIHAHAKKYNPGGYGNKDGLWQKNPGVMERKTPLRILLTQWGYLDVGDTVNLLASDEVVGGEAPDPNAVKALPEKTPEASLKEMGYAAEPKKESSATTATIDAKEITETSEWDLPDGFISHDEYYYLAYNGDLGFTADPELAQSVVMDLGLVKASDYSKALIELSKNFPRDGAA